MQPSAFDEENGVLGPPPSMKEGEDCDSLSVFRDGQVVVSCWRPSKEELEEIVKTGRVWLMVWGITMPPVAITGFKPFTTK